MEGVSSVQTARPPPVHLSESYLKLWLDFIPIYFSIIPCLVSGSIQFLSHTLEMFRFAEKSVAGASPLRPTLQSAPSALIMRKRRRGRDERQSFITAWPSVWTSLLQTFGDLREFQKYESHPVIYCDVSLSFFISSASNKQPKQTRLRSRETLHPATYRFPEPESRSRGVSQDALRCHMTQLIRVKVH